MGFGCADLRTAASRICFLRTVGVLFLFGFLITQKDCLFLVGVWGTILNPLGNLWKGKPTTPSTTGTSKNTAAKCNQKFFWDHLTSNHLTWFLFGLPSATKSRKVRSGQTPWLGGDNLANAPFTIRRAQQAMT